MEKKTTCLSCQKEVKVWLTAYGGGEVGVCPLCNQLAYSGEKEKKVL